MEIAKGVVGTGAADPDSTAGRSTLKWANRDARLVGVTAFAFFALLEVPGIFNGGKGGVGNQIFAGVIVVSCVSVAIRSAVAFTIRASEAGLCTRTLVRSRSYRRSEIAKLEVCRGPVGQMAWTRKVFTVTTSDGNKRWFKDLNTRPKATDLDDFVEALKGELARFRFIEPPEISKEEPLVGWNQAKVDRFSRRRRSGRPSDAAVAWTTGTYTMGQRVMAHPRSFFTFVALLEVPSIFNGGKGGIGDRIFAG